MNILEIEGGSNRSHFFGELFFKEPMDCRKTDFAMTEYSNFNIKRAKSIDAKGSLRNITLCVSCLSFSIVVDGKGSIPYSAEDMNKECTWQKNICYLHVKHCVPLDSNIPTASPVRCCCE